MKKFVSIMTVLLMGIFLTHTASAYSISTDFVSEVSDIGNYTPHGTIYLRDEAVKIYIEVRDVNYDGFSNVDFVIIIRDPLNNFVAMERMDLRNRDYEDDVYVVYTKDIPGYWLDGMYKVEIYAYDRTDPVRIKELENDAKEDPEVLIENGNFDSLKNFFESGSGMDIVKPFSESKSSSRKMSFTLMTQEDINTEDEQSIIASAVGPNFVIKRIDTDKFKVRPNETMTVSVETENLGLSGTKKIEILINGMSEASKTITLEPLESQTVNFDVVRYEPGTYKITIPGEENLMKLFFVIESEGDGVSENITTESSNLTGILPEVGGLSTMNNILVVLITSIVLAVVTLLALSRSNNVKKDVRYLYASRDNHTDIEQTNIESNQIYFKEMIDD